MKNLFYILVLSLLFLSACDNVEDAVFDENPEQRLSSVLSDYKAKLIEGDGKWIAYYFGNAISMKFNEDNTVEFESTYNDGDDDNTISYRISASQIPELTFESYSVFHAIYEANRDEAEYEFLFDQVSDDRIDFISKTDSGSEKTRLSFFKSSDGDLEEAKEMMAEYSKLSFFKKLIIEGSEYEAQVIGFSDKIVLRIPLDDGRYQIIENDYEISKNGLLFPKGLEVDGLIVESFDFDKENSGFTSEVDGKKITIVVGEVLESEAGVFNGYMSVNLRNVKQTSYAIKEMVPSLVEGVPLLNEIQIYSEFGYVLCYAPGTPGSNWGGFSDFTFAEKEDAPEQLQVTWGYLTFGPWWRDVYNTDGAKMLLALITDPNGVYISKYGLNSYILISNTDPSMYILVE
ncbi:hypothetical protein BZG01_14195 [Labilibaculum manganireducens]|uniref:DUF4302 domain-containing protein n=1 Tax=Labilibaculum manganireducens TaxID=1940525 RepID=A0A2N3I2Z6_9BACT|nr:DUF4302 domain-containing protein [Labilibaculum manganireducens]PKQ64679.1 hypothetical protein BZG01_14195 [Labilibaculum manganireducens]